mmetsp:Transcript_10355/g.13598  ORF Transcript_10355/g.13598 Transcript_10355/m.13598 type:complete len:377 (-) Transcript_10355:64-1194(-)|eukprot:CAMPEP_0184007986 /NCGR_PEP_ID=MMETSP0954-20121128/1678_1 /TAXON_ID=627963 /ORGANISM="Aplanochytrium sp, Strain PBS07" /LENGTH=376 /DNA_ID=CAMNT_0026286957 /DNA_START=71 /DNA_END=1198 /DNA_ORIENTATION=-
MTGADYLDGQAAAGYDAQGDDWSYTKSSQRKDRPLSNEELKVLTQKSDFQGFKQLLSQYAMIAGAAGLVLCSSEISAPVLRIAAKAVGTCTMGFGLVTMGHCAQHECIHNTAFKSKKVNTFVSWLVSLPRFTNPVWEKMLHKDHHTYTNDPARDPEIMSGHPRNSLPGGFVAYLQKIMRIGGGYLGLGVWSTRAAILFNCARGKVVGYSGFDPVPEKKAKRVKPELQRVCRIQLGFYVCVFGAIAAFDLWKPAFCFWMLPMLVGEPMHAFFHIADHLNCEHDFKNGRANTRTTPAPYFISFNMWNMNYHAEHHLYPSIPFHKLPEAHKKLEGHFEHTSPSAIAMHKSLLSDWIPYFIKRKEKGIQYVEEEWVPCPE